MLTISEIAQSACLAINNSYAYSTNNFFVINSALDAFSLAPYLNDTSFCAMDKPDRQLLSCQPSDVAILSNWRSMFLNDLTNNPSYSKDGNGAFIYSCYEHATPGFQSEPFFEFTLNCSTQLNEALLDWFLSGSSPACDHIFLPCEFPDDVGNTTTGTCNPTCSLPGSSLSNGQYPACISDDSSGKCTSPTTSPTSNENDNTKLPAGAIAGIVVGVLVGLGIIFGGFYFFWEKCLKTTSNNPQSKHKSSL